MATGEIEITADEFYTLAPSKTPPFEIEDETTAHEQLRLEYRYLDLRRQPLQDNLHLRHRTTMAVRRYLDEQGFYEIETPLLIRSTPEGARDYVVPSRVSKGKFFALPQSPQLLKQILMVSGFDKYFQIARCLRDEDLRSDRQPEHTQIDMEMSFVTPDDVFRIAEGMLEHLFSTVLNTRIQIPFPRVTFEEAMNRWGTDKPDTRYAMELVDFSAIVADCGFRVFVDNVRGGGVVKGIVLKGGAGYSRKQVEELTARVKELGGGGLAYLLRTPDQDKSPILKFLGDGIKDALCSHAKAETGDALFIVSDQHLKTEAILGQLRVELARRHNLVKAGEWKFLWVTEFPLFEYDSEKDGLVAMHNIVSQPLEQDLPLVEEGYRSSLPLSNPEHPWRRARAAQYDLVVNGWEIASGGQRISQRRLQEQILEILGIDRERAQRMFGFLLRALEYGAPPHAGLAPCLLYTSDAADD